MWVDEPCRPHQGAAEADGRGQPEHGVDLERDRQARRRLEPRRRPRPNSARGFLLNHLIGETLPDAPESNADPITGQAAWYDLRVRVEKAPAAEAGESAPHFPCARPAALADAGARNSALRLERAMTDLPAQHPGGKKLGLVIDLDVCVGCHACATACKEWNSGGHSAPLPDFNPYGEGAWGVWFNRVHSFEEGDGEGARTVHFPRSCLHCEEPACVTVCPTGASYKRAEDGIVLVNADICIGCKLCSWACPYGAREFDQDEGVMKKCTLCIDRIYNENLAEDERVPACVMVCPTSARHFGDLGDPNSAVSEMVAARGGKDLMPELGYRPVNKYLPPRHAPHITSPASAAAPSGGDPPRRQQAAALGRPAAVAVRHELAIFRCIPRYRSSSSPPPPAPVLRS